MEQQREDLTAEISRVRQKLQSVAATDLPEDDVISDKYRNMRLLTYYYKYNV